MTRDDGNDGKMIATDEKAAFRELRAQGIDPGSKLHLRRVIEQGDARALSLVLCAGASPNTAFGDGFRAIDLAIQKKQGKLARMLADVGADLGPTDPVAGLKPPAPPLHQTLLNRDEETAIHLLRVGAVPDLLHDNKSPLEFAAFQGLSEAFVHILDAQSEPNLNDALFFACAGGYEGIARTLVERGAALALRDNGGEGLSSMLRAIEKGRSAKATDYVKRLGERCEALFAAMLDGALGELSLEVLDGALRTAALRGMDDETDALLAAGANPKTAAAHDQPRRSLMEAVVWNDRLHSAKALLDAMRAKRSLPEDAARWLCFADVEAMATLLQDEGLELDANARLCQAARQMDLEGVDAALQDGANADVEVGPGPLLYATVERVANPPKAIAKDTAELAKRRTGFFAVLERLLAAGAKANVEGRIGPTALAKATWYGLDEFSGALLKAGADMDPGTFQRTPLHGAARQGNLDLVNLCIAADVALDHEDKTAQTAIFLAAARGHTACVQRLLEAGANPNVVASNGSSALGLAVWNGHLEVVRALCAHGVDMAIVNAKGESVVSMAVDRGRGDDYLDLLFDAGASPNGFVYSNPLVARRLEQKGADDALVVRARKGDDQTAVLACAICGDLEGLERLLAGRGAVEALELREEIAFGRTVLDFALRFGQVQAAARLREAGIELGLKSLACALQASTPDGLHWLVQSGEFHPGLIPPGERPLRQAVHSKSAEVMAALIENAEVLGMPEEVARYGADAMRLAAYWRQKEIIQVLLDAGVHPDAVAYGEPKSALMEAIDRSATDSALVLIEAGASLGPSRYKGRTPLIEAAIDGNAPLVTKLIELGSDLDHRDDEEGLTALEWAAKFNRADALAVLESRGQEVVNAWAKPTPEVLRGIAEQLTFVRRPPGDYRVAQTEAPMRRLLLTESVEVASAVLPEHLAPTGTWLEALVACNRLSRSYGMKDEYTLRLEESGEVHVTSHGGHRGFRLLSEAEWEVAVSLELIVPDETSEWVFDLLGTRWDGLDINPRGPRTIDRSQPIARVLRSGGPRLYSPEGVGRVRVARGPLGSPIPRKVEYGHVVGLLQRLEGLLADLEVDQARRVWERVLEMLTRYFGSESSALSEMKTLQVEFGPIALAVLARRGNEEGLRFALAQGASSKEALPDGRLAIDLLHEPDGSPDEISRGLLARVAG